MDHLPVALSSAVRAAPLPIEDFQTFTFRRQLVSVPFDQFPREFGIHRFERAHVAKLEQQV